MRKLMYIKKCELIDGKITWFLTIDDVEETVSISLSDNVASFATPERCDAIVMGLLIFAIRNKYDIKSDVPLTASLSYNLEHHLIDAICGNEIDRPTIIAPLEKDVEKIDSMVLTGVSCGVDSIYTVATNLKTCDPAHDLTHLAFFNVGSHYTGDDRSKSLFEGRRAKCLAFSNAVGLPMIEIGSDLPQFIARHSKGYSHEENHTFMSVFCLLTIQKGFRYYYYSSGMSYRDFNCKYIPHGHYDSSRYDLLTLTMSSYGKHRFYSSGGNISRLNKTLFISTFPAAQEYLNVCVNTVENDNTCFKCRRTLLSLDASGNLDKFGKVFDLDYYYKNRKGYIESMYVSALRGDKLMAEILPYFKKELTISLKFRALAKKARSSLKNRICKK